MWGLQMGKKLFKRKCTHVLNPYDIIEIFLYNIEVDHFHGIFRTWTLLVTMKLYGYRCMNIKNELKSDFEHENIAILFCSIKTYFYIPHPHFHSYQINMLSTLTKGHFTLQTLKFIKLIQISSQFEKNKYSDSKYTYTPDETG